MQRRDAAAALASLAITIALTGPSAAQRGARTSAPLPSTVGRPVELELRRAGSSTRDLRTLPPSPPRPRDRDEGEDPEVVRIELAGGIEDAGTEPLSAAPQAAPSPSTSFVGLDFANWGGGRPPDTVGDVGPVYFIQAVNMSLGVFRKSDGARIAAFTFDTFMSQGNFGNLCDTDNFGDPVVLYDTFEDRWVITDFAFQIDGSGNVLGPGAFQCFAVSKTGDPVTGGWNFFSLAVSDLLNDYPKFGIWPDGIYMSANMFDFHAPRASQGTRVWAFNKAQLYAGAPVVQIVQFTPPTTEYALLPANARLQAGTPPPGSPNYFGVVWQYTNAFSVYKFHVDWSHVSLSSFTGPFVAIAPASWINPPNTVPAQGGSNNDTLPIRLLMQNQYTNLGGVESLWATHTVRHPTTSGVAAVRYYQVDVTGGTVAANTTQAATHAPDTTNRYIPSLAVDRAGNMAIGYNASSSVLFPALRYAGRLATDPPGTLPQTEASLIEGSGAQVSGTSTRWGDYATMTLDPNGCTFWFTGEYFTATGANWQTRIGAFAFPGASCAPVGSGTLQGTVTAAAGGAPIAGATVTLGSRTTITNAAGFYQFTLVAAGTYPTLGAAAPGFAAATATSVAVSTSAITTRNFALATASTGGCVVDTTQADFQAGLPTATDLVASPGDVVLQTPVVIDQQNSTLSGFGAPISTTAFGGQTFTPSVSGSLTRVDVNLFCNGCGGTTPDVTVSLRPTAGGLPSGGDLATATITGFNSGSAIFRTATFAAPPVLTAGTQYALVVRPSTDPSFGSYNLTRSGSAASGADVYAGGARVSDNASGTSWSTPLLGGVSTDAGFKIFMQAGYTAAGEYSSSPKDANPAPGFRSTWATLSWNAGTPAGTTLKFQAAAANSPAGPFGFVGPDGTASTFFSSGAALGQFDGARFLEYKAFLATANGAVTPAVHDATVCFADVPAGLFHPLTPCRVLDTRNTNGMFGGPALGAGAARVFPFANVCGIPATAAAVSFNVTVTGAQAGGFLTLFAGNAPAPGTSNISFSAGSTRANNGIVTLANDGTGGIKILNSSAGTVHVIVDVSGYFD